jgi:hypothetical protein
LRPNTHHNGPKILILEIKIVEELCRESSHQLMESVLDPWILNMVASSSLVSWIVLESWTMGSLEHCQWARYMARVTG